MNQKHYFYCYDMKLFNHLNQNGMRFITKARHHKTGDLFSLYEHTDELSALLSEWQSSSLEKVVQKQDG
jgi:hypothetical protein